MNTLSDEQVTYYGYLMAERLFVSVSLLVDLCDEKINQQQKNEVIFEVYDKANRFKVDFDALMALHMPIDCAMNYYDFLFELVRKYDEIYGTIFTEKMQNIDDLSVVFITLRTLIQKVDNLRERISGL